MEENKIIEIKETRTVEDELANKRSYRRAFVGGDKAAVYEKKFDRIDAGKKFSWNWCAFLFTACWFLYRRMYRWFFIALGAGIVLGYLEDLIFGGMSYNAQMVANVVISLAVCVAFGIFGDRIYLKKIDKFYNESPIRENEILHHGGTSLAALLIYLGIMFVMIMMVILVFGMVLSGM